MVQRVHDFDWSTTSIGARSQWPVQLAIMVDLVLASRQPMFLYWGTERVLIYNDAFIPITGHRHPDALGMNAPEVWHEAWPALAPLVDRAFQGESISMTRFRVDLLQAGVLQDAFFDFSFTPVRSTDGGTVLGLLCVCADITVSLAAERTLLRDAERDRQRIFEMSRDLFAVATFDGFLRSVNPAWSLQLGWSDHDLLSRPFSELIHPEDLEVTGDVVKTLIAGQPVHQFLVRLMRTDGSAVAYAWSAVPELDPPNGTFYTVGRDITEEQAAAAELQSAQAALRQSQKMEAVGQLTGGIAHDFNNLLGGINASLQVLQMRLSKGKTEGAERYIAMGQQSVNRAAALTHRLLAFSRQQTLSPEPTDLNRLVGGMEELIRRTVGPSVGVEVIAAGGLWSTKIDSSQLENSLLNLCINARDAMPEGGRLTIETANKWLDSRAARERELEPGQYVSLCVSDTGIGMDENTASRVFDPFFTTKPMGQGTGLGLSMVYGFVRQSGGQVCVTSTLGRGTTMCLYLPRHFGDVADEAAEPIIEPEAAGNGETVLVVEDEATIRILVTEVLQEAGYHVIAVDDGPAAMRAMESSRRIDLLVTDVGLPGGMNGKQVADTARALQPMLKVLFVTGYADSAAVGNGLLEPGMDVMTKPFEITAFLNKVRDLIERDGPA